MLPTLSEKDRRKTNSDSGLFKRGNSRWFSESHPKAKYVNQLPELDSIVFINILMVHK